MHATRSNGAAPRLSQIEVVSQKGRYGELLKAELQDLLDPDHSIRSKQYRLVIALETISNPLVIEQDGTASRIRIDFRSPYTLTRLADGALIKQGTLKRTHSYSVSEFADYASVIAERDVTRRGVEALARDYAQRLGGLLQ